MPALDTHDRIGELCARWIRAVQRHHRAALGVTLALVALLGVVSAARLGVNSDVNAMVAPFEPIAVRPSRSK